MKYLAKHKPRIFPKMNAFTVTNNPSTPCLYKVPCCPDSFPQQRFSSSFLNHWNCIIATILFSLNYLGPKRFGVCNQPPTNLHYQCLVKIIHFFETKAS